MSLHDLIRVYEDNQEHKTTFKKYKSKTEINSAVFYCPYVPLTTYGFKPKKVEKFDIKKIKKIYGSFIVR